MSRRRRHKKQRIVSSQELGKLRVMQNGTVIIERLEGMKVIVEMHDDFIDIGVGTGGCK
jgi:hypothetical protein